ncbi:MAG: transglutaminase-like domain-containing protein [Candidatus Methanomethylicia archaeon]|jgi:hypothetical protein|nr:transglutaminase-like domain-containing protein [Candidatus Methanomethylicia archaeon]
MIIFIPILLLINPIAYQYNITITLINKGETLFPNTTDSPYYYLLNQNIFPNTTYQEVVLESVLINSSPVLFKMHLDIDGNPWIEVITDKPIKTNESLSLSLSFLIKIKNRDFDISGISSINDLSKNLSEKYPLIGIWNLSNRGLEEVSKLVYSIKGSEDNTLIIILKILEWFEENIKYNSSLTYPQELLDTYHNKSGDCDDQANLFVLFCRILGIPSYTSIGAIYIPGSRITDEHDNMRFILNNVVWHGWAMVYLPKDSKGEWFPVDLTFFKGAYTVNNYIRSRNLLDHITGSAFSKQATFEYMRINSTNYINDYFKMKNIMNSYNVTWIEEHYVYPIYEIPSWLLILIISIISILVLYKIRNVLLRKCPFYP